MSDFQKQTVARYQTFLEAISLSAALQTALGSGVIASLRRGPKDLEQLASECNCDAQSLECLVRVLVSVGAVERYGDDLALSQALQLLSQSDADLGARLWRELPTFLAGWSSSTDSLHSYRRRVTSRQWSHTAAAMQAAEVLDIGGLRRGLKILELGSGAGVWSAAMAYRDPEMHVTLVDSMPMLDQCHATFSSIELLDRCALIEDDYRTWSTPLAEFDLVVLPEVVQLEQDAAAVVLLGRAVDALKPNGQLVIMETLREADGPALALATQGLEVAVATGGRQRSASELQALIRGAGLGAAQWGWLTASTHGIGLIVATKDDHL